MGHLLLLVLLASGGTKQHPLIPRSPWQQGWARVPEALSLWQRPSPWDSALWAPGTPWSLEKFPGLHTGPSQAAPCPTDPKDTACLERFHHFLKVPDKPRLLTHRPRGPPCMGSSVGKLSTGRIFISALSGPQLQTLSTDGNEAIRITGLHQ